MANRLDKAFPWLIVTLVLSLLLSLYWLTTTFVYPRLDIEAQRVVSPDGCYVVTHTYDSFGGATVRCFHLVDLSRTKWPKSAVPLLRTYGSPEEIAIRWVDSHNLEIVGHGMKGVEVQSQFTKGNWEGVNVRIQLKDN
jgi:hypothetical protein